jgi:outer membrane protein TolC
MLKTIVILGSIVASSGVASALTLQEYLAQVEKENLAYQGNQANAEGAHLVAREADLITSPVFFASAKYNFDGKMLNPPATSYDDTRTNTYQLGVSQQFDFGLQAKFSYSLIKTEYVGANFNPGVAREFWDLSPRVELTMPLLANGFGRTVQANKEYTRQQNLSNEYSALAKSKNLLADAEFAYWRLATALERVAIQESALKAGQNIFSYVDSQKRKNLGESADVLQARALTEANQLQLQQAMNEREAAKRLFNTYINIPTDSNIPKLEAVNYAELEKTQIPDVRPGDRLDLKAARAQAALAKASSELIIERNKPTLDVTAGYALNGRGLETGNAFSNASKLDRDSGYVGVLFQLPLNFKATADAKAGAQRLKDSAEINVQNITYTQDQDWMTLKEKLNESKITLKLARNMELAQKSKLENERSRLRQGRTTTYQVLLFEQDYTAAQASRVQAIRDIIALQTQIKLYQTTPAGEI